jgi:hypothetical protein
MKSPDLDDILLSLKTEGLASSLYNLFHAKLVSIMTTCSAPSVLSGENCCYSGTVFCLCQTYWSLVASCA